MTLTVDRQTIVRVSSVDYPTIRTNTMAVNTPRPLRVGWTTDQPWFYTLEKDSHRFSLGNEFGVAGPGIGSEAYVYPGQKADRGEGLTFISRDEPFFPYCDSFVTNLRWSMAVSERVEAHENTERIGGPQRRFVQVLNTSWPITGDPATLKLTHGFMTVPGTTTADSATYDLLPGEADDVAVAFFDPSIPTTPTALLWNDNGSLYVQVAEFPRLDVETINYEFDNLAPDPVLGVATIVATGLKVSAADGYRGIEATNLGTNSVLVVSVQNDGSLQAHTLTFAGGSITIDTVVIGTATQLQGIEKHPTDDKVLVPISHGTSTEILLLDTSGTVSVESSRTISSSVKAWATWCGDTPVCSTLTSGGIATVRSMTMALGDVSTTSPNTVAWLAASLYGRPDGRLLIAGSGEGIEDLVPDYYSITEGAWFLYHVDNGLFTMVDQIVPDLTSGDNRYGDHVVPFDDDTCMVNTAENIGGIVSLAGVFHTTYMTTLYPWTNNKVIEINPNVSSGDWNTPIDEFYLSLRVLEFDSSGIPLRVTRRAIPLWDPNFFHAIVALDDDRFLLCGLGESTEPTIGDSDNYIQIWELSDTFELVKSSEMTWDDGEEHAIPWCVKLADGRVVYAALRHTNQLIFALIDTSSGTPVVVSSHLVDPAGGVGNTSFNEQHPIRLYELQPNTLVLLYQIATGFTSILRVEIVGDTFVPSVPTLNAGKLGSNGARDNHPCQIGSSIYHVVKFTGSQLASRWGIPNPDTGLFTLLTHVVKIDLDDSAVGGVSGALLSPDTSAVPPSGDSDIQTLLDKGYVEGFNDSVIVPLAANEIAMLGGAALSFMGWSPMVASRWKLEPERGKFTYIEDSETAYIATDDNSYPWNGVSLGDGKACFVAGIAEMFGRGTAGGYDENGFIGTVRVLTALQARGIAVAGAQLERVSKARFDSLNG